MRTATDNTGTLDAHSIRTRIEMAMALLEEAERLVRIDQGELCDPYNNDNYEAWKVTRRAQNSVGDAHADLRRNRNDIRENFEGGEQ